MNVDYITEINGLDDWELGKPLSPTAYKVMRKLLYLAYKEQFPERLKVTNGSLCSMVGCTENSLFAARQQLIQRGLIEYKGGKKAMPTYTILYFSHRPFYNLNICGINGGINRGINGGNMWGLNGGIAGGQDIDEEEDFRDEEDIYNNIPIAPEGQAIGNPLLQYPIPTLPSVDVDGRARASGRTPRYPPRTRRLTREEAGILAGIDTVLSHPVCQKLFGKNVQIITEMLNSDRFPLELVGEAISRTLKRNSRYTEPLSNPVAYTQTLLEDWESEGFRTVRDIREARGDYSDDY